MKHIAIVCLIICSTVATLSLAKAESWIAYGQTRLPYMQVLDNPVTNVTGAEGELNAWPYTVPIGKTLCIHSMAVESYNSNSTPFNQGSGVTVMFLMVGLSPFTNDQLTATVAANRGTNQIDTNYCWPEGTLINLRLINGQAEYNEWVYGWQIIGTLTP